MDKILLIYHKEDNDGVFSAALFVDYLINTLHISRENIVLMGSEYNSLASFAKENAVEDLHKEYSNIIITDVSFNDPKYMKKLWKEFGNDFTWCDHHAPIIKASRENKFDDVPGVRDTGRSAILCVWKYLYDQFDEAYNEKKLPEWLRILSAWDSWTYEKEGYEFDYVRNVNKGTTDTYDLDIEAVIPIISSLREVYLTGKPSGKFSASFKDESIIKEMHDRGKLLNDYDDKVMAQIMKFNGDCDWKIMTGMLGDSPTWRPACAIFHQGATNSTMFKSVREQCANGIVFKHAKNGNWTVSLYNTDDSGKFWNNDYFHCGDFCKKHYNGGGHAGAAGFTLTQAQFIKILKEKKLG